MLQLDLKLVRLDVVAQVVQVLPAQHRHPLELFGGAHAARGAELIQRFFVLIEMLPILLARLAHIKRLRIPRKVPTPPTTFPKTPAPSASSAVPPRRRVRAFVRKLLEHGLDEFEALVREVELISGHVPALEAAAAAAELVAVAMYEVVPLERANAPPRWRLPREPTWVHVIVAERLPHT